jgi:flagellar biogenesis protein FliO
MDWLQLINAGFALIFVLCLVGLTSLLLRKYSNKTNLDRGDNSKSKQKIKILESKIIDNRRKLVLVENGDSEHLLLLSTDKELLIETKTKTKNSKEN